MVPTERAANMSKMPIRKTGYLTGQARRWSIFAAATAVLLSGALSVRPSSLSAVQTENETSELELRRMIGQMVLVGFVGDNPDAEGYKTVLQQAQNGESRG